MAACGATARACVATKATGETLRYNGLLALYDVGTARFARDAERAYVLDPATGKLLVFAASAAPSSYDVALVAGVWERKRAFWTTEAVALAFVASVAVVALGFWAYFEATKKRGAARK